MQSVGRADRHLAAMAARFLWSAWMTLVITVILSKHSHAQELPKIFVTVSLSQQIMTVDLGYKRPMVWRVSTARSGKVTPKGRWTVQWLSKNHKSSLYNNAPMPFSIFYNGNFAIHGTTQLDRLGAPASAGCVRLHPDNAAVLFYLVEQVGLDNVMIEVAD